MTESKTMTELHPDDIAMSFKNLSISSLVPPKPILSNISGFVKKGGITAIMGASAAGKSVLMQVLAGRLPMLHVSGEVTMNGKEVDIHHTGNEVSYVPQDDFLIGELTPRETLKNTAYMKRTTSIAEIDKEVDELLRKFGLSHVADNAIGTVFVRGLSGGQRKRVEVCSELISPHSVLMLDEPTSGLDGAIAYDVLAATKKILESRCGDLSIILSIHQPNSRILELFDHIMLIGGGDMLFFGTLPESISYFSSIGFPPPEVYTPTDVFLQVSDKDFGENHDFDFVGSFACSSYWRQLHLFLEDVKRLGFKKSLSAESTKANNNGTPLSTTPINVQLQSDASDNWRVVKVRPGDENDDAQHHIDEETGKVVNSSMSNLENSNIKPVKKCECQEPEDDSWSTAYFRFTRQYWGLLYRDFTLAYRDPSLYYLQLGLVSMFGFLVGATFFNLTTDIGQKMTNVNSGLLWIVLVMVYIPVFKVYHLSRSQKRFEHENTNNMYSPLAFWCAELTATSILMLTFIPGATIAYFMMGLPGAAYPYLLFVFWLCALTSESMLGFIAKLTHDTTIAIVAAQAVLVVLTIFGGGSFIAWDKCPDYWFWLQELSVFTQGSRAAIMGTNDYLNYACVLNSSGQCVGPLGDVFPCESYNTAMTTCVVNGREWLHTMQGTRVGESKWIPFAYLVFIFGVFRVLQLGLLYFSMDKISYAWEQYIGGENAKNLLESKLGLKRVEGQLNAFISLFHNNNKSNANKNNNDEENTALLSISEGSELPTPIVAKQDDVNAKVFASINDVDFGVETDKLQPLAHGACLEWKNLSVILPKNNKRLVDSVSGTALPGRVLALMGPSGAGKTTLLNALSNRAPYARLEGEVLFSGRPFTAADLVYVPQFDEFNPNLTVKEQIAFVGEMKCKDVREMRTRLNHLLEILGLAMKANVLCKLLTSGELKRVSVGMGMISNPNVLFLDEPTTGLDSSAAYSIVKYLAELSAATKVVVIMTIHQPAPMVFDLLQDLYLLELGRLAFFGPLKSTKKYFSTLGFECSLDVNPADFYLDLVSAPPLKQLTEMNNNNQLSHLSTQQIDTLTEKFTDKTWTHLYQDSLLSKNLQKLLSMTLEVNQVSGVKKDAQEPPNNFSRLLTLMQFFTRYYWRDIGFYHLRVVFLVIVAVFIGTMFLDLQPKMTNIPQYSGSVFFNIWTALFSAVAATGLLAADRRQSIEQVKNAVMTPSVYCLAQFIVSAPFNFVASVIYQSIFHWLININPNGESFIFAIFITCGHLMLMEAFMLTVVQVLKNAMLSVTFAMCVLGYLFLFAGFFIPVRNMPPSIFWISYITPTHYSFNGYLWQVYSTQDFDVPGMSGVTVSGKTLLDSLYGIKDVNSWGMFGTLLAWVVLIRLAHYAIFLYEVKPYLASAQKK